MVLAEDTQPAGDLADADEAHEQMVITTEPDGTTDAAGGEHLGEAEADAEPTETLRDGKRRGRATLKPLPRWNRIVRA